MGSRRQRKESFWESLWEVALSILILSLSFLGIVFLFEQYNINIDPEIIVVALVPVIIALLITGKLAISEIQTPTGLKILLTPLSDSLSLNPPIKPTIENIGETKEERIINVSKYMATDSMDEKLPPSEKRKLKSSIQSKNTNILAFSLGRPYATDLIQTCMEAIIDDKQKTIKYLLFTNKRAELAGMMKISNAFYNRLLPMSFGKNKYGNWGELADDIRSESVLDYPGTIEYKDAAIQIGKTQQEALRIMDENGYQWLPVVNKERKCVGAITEAQIFRDFLLSLEE